MFIVNDSQISVTTPVVEGAPVVEGDPVVEGAPVVEGDPVVEGAPVVEGVPVVEGDPVVEGAPVVKGVPVVEGVPVVDEVPVEQVSTVKSHLHSLVFPPEHTSDAEAHFPFPPDPMLASNSPEHPPPSFTPNETVVPDFVALTF